MANKKLNATAEIAFEGEMFEVNPAAARSYTVIRGVTFGGAGLFEALDALFAGRTDEYAARLGDDFEQLVNLAAEALGEFGAKN